MGLKMIIIGFLLSIVMSGTLLGVDVMTGADADLCSDAQKLPYDIICPVEWLSQLREAFVIATPPGYYGTENRVCLKFKNEPDRYYMYTVSEARKISYLATKVDATTRTELPRSSLTHGDHHVNGDFVVVDDGETIYGVGHTHNYNKLDIYESPMYPSNGEDFDFKYKATFDPSVQDPRFDYYYVGGQLAIREGDKYVLTFAAARVPEGKSAQWATDNNVEIQTQFYQMAYKNSNGDFEWEGYPRMINAYVVNVDIGTNLGTQLVVQGGMPRTHQSWSAPAGGQINGIHLNGDIFEIEGERWYYWVWFEQGNHIASARIADDFRFDDPSDAKKIWHEPINIVQNSNPVAGEQGINENATAFKKEGKYYFIFTHGHVVGNYSMSYFIGDSFETIARGIGEEHKLYEAYPNLGDVPFHTPGLREIGGSGRAVTKRNGEMFMFYGIGTFDHLGNYQGRRPHYSKLSFNPDGTIVPLKQKPTMQIDPHRIPSAIQLSWTDPGDYEYHLNALVDGELLIEHPTNPGAFGMGYAQLNAGVLGSSTSWNLEAIEFVSETYPGNNEMISIDEFKDLDGFQLSYSSDSWTSSQSFKTGYNRRTSQHFRIDGAVEEGIHLSWDSPGNYENRIEILQDDHEIVEIPGYGSGSCFLGADELGFSSYTDLRGFYFTPVGTSEMSWLNIADLPEGYQYSFRVSYAYHGNWDISSLCGSAVVLWTDTTSFHVSIGDPDHDSPLFANDDRTHLFAGHTGGVAALEHNGSAYSIVGGWGSPADVVEMASVPGGMHLLSATGLTFFSYNASTGTFAEDGSTSFSDATGMAIAPDGTIYTSRNNEGGLDSWTYADGTYTNMGHHGSVNAMDIAVDSKGYIHVAQSEGLSTWTFSGGTFVQQAFQGGAYHSGSAVYVGDDDVIRYGKFDGVNNMVYHENNQNYTDLGFSRTTGSVNDIEIGADGMWVVHNGGIHLFDAATLAYTGHFEDNANYGICIDADGKVHTAKWNGIVEFVYTPGVKDNITPGDFFRRDGSYRTMIEFDP
ncbi:MAG: hypothetical protein ABFS10_01585 [Bacteroidota bacterium]